MGRPCSICIHPDREAIDRALMAGESYRSIAGREGVSASALNRHDPAHLTDLLAKASAAETIAADDLLGQVLSLQSSTLSILRKAESAGTMTVALSAIREARGNIELFAKLTNQLNDRPVTNVLIAPEWLTVRTVLLEALNGYPEARTAVASRLLELESGA